MTNTCWITIKHLDEKQRLKGKNKVSIFLLEPVYKGHRLLGAPQTHTMLEHKSAHANAATDALFTPDKQQSVVNHIYRHEQKDPGTFPSQHYKLLKYPPSCALLDRAHGQRQLRRKTQSYSCSND